MNDDLTTDRPQITANDMVMAKEMADILNTAYPGHLWAVHVDGAGSGFADVRNLAFSGAWGFRVKLKDIYSASQFKKDILRAGGEVLERYRQRRGAFSDSDFQSTPTDRVGNFKADL